MTTCQCLVPRYIREEHKAHSPKCEFLLLNKKEEDWTVEDLLELETKRQINRMVNFFTKCCLWLPFIKAKSYYRYALQDDSKQQQSQKLLFHPRIIIIAMFG